MDNQTFDQLPKTGCTTFLHFSSTGTKTEIATCGLRTWRPVGGSFDAKLPTPKMPKLIRKKHESDVSDGSLSVTEEKPKVLR
jgi:hypothetical protein